MLNVSVGAMHQLQLPSFPKVEKNREIVPFSFFAMSFLRDNVRLFVLGFGCGFPPKVHVLEAWFSIWQC